MTKLKFGILILLIFSFANLVACNNEEYEYEWKVLDNPHCHISTDAKNDDAYYDNVDKSLKTYWEVLTHFKI